MKFLQEHIYEPVKYLEEKTETGDKKQYISGIFMQAECANKNKRIYPLAVLESEAHRYTIENINKNKGFGEISHPTTPNINIDRVCIYIKSLQKENNDFIGKALVASTPAGQIISGILNDGAQLGVSTRGLGSLKSRGEINEVQNDFRLCAIDIVADPSGPDCYVQGIMENREWVFDSVTGLYSEQIADNHKTFIKKASIQEIEARKFKMFEQFLAGLIRK